MQRISSSDKSTWKIEHYVKANTDELFLLLKERILDHKTWGFLLSISPFVLFESCKIGYANGKKMTIEDISEAIGMSYKTARKYMKDLCENLIVAKWKGEYYVNPWIMYRGSVIDKFLITLFKDYYIRSRGMYWHEFVCL